MNDDIRRTVREAIEKKGVSQNEFARSLGCGTAALSRVLSGQAGFMPGIWTRILDALGYELKIVKKKPSK